MEIYCPACGNTNIKKNGHTHSGKQNHWCNECYRQFVENPTQKRISDRDKGLIRKLLLERISLHGICRVMKVSFPWLLEFIVSVYAELPDDLNFRPVEETDELFICTLESEVDEMWSFVGSKKNKQWIWIAMDVKSRQIIAFHVGDRSRERARNLWHSIPEIYREKATFYTDDRQAYIVVIPETQHRAVSKQISHKHNTIKRMSCIHKQREPR